jgi:ubiquinone biosynthesis monooxygenase Coq7
MKKTDKKILEEIIRVDHAGEKGAIKIYEGQLLALNTIKNDPNLLEQVAEMKSQEQNHYNYYERKIQKRNIKTTKLLPLWDLLGVGLGFGSVKKKKKATMLCTASVEEAIDKHYSNQIDKLEPDETNLKDKISEFRDDELHHKNIAYELKKKKNGLYSIFDKIIKTGSRIAINISEKI